MDKLTPHTGISMKILPRLLVLIGLPLAPTAHASEVGTSAHPFGLGLTVGYPTGISGKYYLANRGNAIQGTVAVDPGVGEAGGLYLDAVHLWHPSVLTQEVGFVLPWHGGVGGFLSDGYGWGSRFGDGAALGVRGVIGLDFDLEDIPLQISGDLGLNIGVHSWNGLFYDPSITVGVRYYL